MKRSIWFLILCGIIFAYIGATDVLGELLEGSAGNGGIIVRNIFGHFLVGVLASLLTDRIMKSFLK